jgi:hypothetical protein
MPKRVQSSFNGLSILSPDEKLPPALAEYLQKVPVATEEQLLTIWSDANRDLAMRISQLLESGALSGFLFNCSDGFRKPASLPERFWIVTPVHLILGIVVPGIVIDLKDCNRVKEALLETMPFRWRRGDFLFGAQLWEMEKKDVFSSDDELRLLFHDALFRERRRLERTRGRAESANNPSKNQMRPAIPAHIRTLVWERDRGRCVQCGSIVDLEFDHIIPLSKGGSNTERNIQLLCAKCNLEKGSEV